MSKVLSSGSTDYLLAASFGMCVCIAIPSHAKEPSQLSSSPETVVPANYFQSRFKPGEKGKFNLNGLSQCNVSAPPSVLLPNLLPVVTDFQGEQPIESIARELRILYQSAPEISSLRTHLQGNVSVQDQVSILRAEDVVINHQTQQLNASGGVSRESKNSLFSADSLSLDELKQIVKMDDAQFYLFTDNANGRAEQVLIEEQNKAQLTNLTFSTCPVDSDSWQLASSEMNLDSESGRAEAWNTTLRIKNIPVFYFPYLNFPIDRRRQSGLLSPTLKNSDKSGLDFSQPIYWNIAPNMDATFVPRHMEKRGFQLGTEFRWLTERTYTELYSEWMDKDKVVSDALRNPVVGSTISADDSGRWLGKINHQVFLGNSWQFKLNTQRVSDSDYFRDFSSGLQRSNETQLTSQANLSYEDDIWDINFFAITHQSLIASESYRYLPSLNASADYLDDRGLRWQFDSEWSRFEHNDINQPEGFRANIMPSLSYPVSGNWGFFTPKLSFQSTYYEQESQLTGEKNTFTRNLPIVSFDSALYFDRDSQWSDKDYIHTLSPRVFYSYIPEKDQSQINLFDTTLPIFGFNQLWRENRFNGIDRIGDTNHISIGLSNSLVNSQSGEKAFNFNLGRKYYFENRDTQLNGEFVETQGASPWLAQLSFKVNRSTDIDAFIEWDQHADNTNQARSRIKFEPKANHIVNLSHRYRDIAGLVNEESDFSFAWPVNDSWRLVGRWYNDIRRNQTIEALVGIEYESCCWAIRLVAQKYLNTQLDSLGMPITIGADEYSEGIAGQSGLSDLLESSITGYRDPFLSDRRRN